MATEKQIAANRLNALRSTGPQTEAGKQISRLNAIRHGLTAEHIVIPGESIAELEQFKDEVVAEFGPVGRAEEELVDRLVGLMWRLRRVPKLEAALYAWIHHQQSQVHDDVADNDDGRGVFQAFGRNVRMLPQPKSSSESGRAWTDRQLHIGRLVEAMSDKDLLNKLARHEAHLMNQLTRSLLQFYQLVERRILLDEGRASDGDK